MSIKTSGSTHQVAKKVVVSNTCSACGFCLAANDSLFTETSEGKAIVNGAGIIRDAEISDIQEIIENCPSHSISLQETEMKTSAEIKHLISKNLRNYKLPIPERSKFELSNKNIRFPIPYSSREYQYVYSSYEKAKRAGLEEFNRLMFSQRKSSIQQVFIEYKAQAILPYYKYEKNSSNFYYQIQQQLEKELLALADEVTLFRPDAIIPPDFKQIIFNFNPQKFDVAEYFKNGYEQAQASRVLNELSSDCYSLSSYDVYFDIDDSEEYAGTGLFGGDKYVTKYCFYNLSSAFKELSKDLMDTCNSVITDSIDDAYSYLISLWSYTEKEIQSILVKKADLLEQVL